MLKELLTEEFIQKFTEKFYNKTDLKVQFLIESINEQRNYAYLSTEVFPESDLGVLANNFVNVRIRISVSHVKEDNYFCFNARWKYDHKSLGSNGIGVMTKANNEFWAWYYPETNEWKIRE